MQWAVFSRHASHSAASGRRKQIRTAKRYADYPVEWGTRRMPTEENPGETALTVRWVGVTHVEPLSPPPVGSVALSPEGDPYRLFEVVAEAPEGATESFFQLMWFGIGESGGKPKSQKIPQFGDVDTVSSLRIVYRPNSPAAQENQ